MSRRALTLAILTVITYVVTACATPTAPRNDDTCKGGWGGANTKTCP
jgi:hypothetical protein